MKKNNVFKKVLMCLLMVLSLVLLSGCNVVTKEAGKVEVVDLTGTVSEETITQAKKLEVKRSITVVFSDQQVAVRQYNSKDSYVALIMPNQIIVVSDAYSDEVCSDMANRIAKKTAGLNNDAALIPAIEAANSVATKQYYLELVYIIVFVALASLYIVGSLIDGGGSSSRSNIFVFSGRSSFGGSSFTGRSSSGGSASAWR